MYRADLQKTRRGFSFNQTPEEFHLVSEWLALVPVQFSDRTQTGCRPRRRAASRFWRTLQKMLTGGCFMIPKANGGLVRQRLRVQHQITSSCYEIRLLQLPCWDQQYPCLETSALWRRLEGDFRTLFICLLIYDFSIKEGEEAECWIKNLELTSCLLTLNKDKAASVQPCLHLHHTETRVASTDRTEKQNTRFFSAAFKIKLWDSWVTRAKSSCCLLQHLL